MSLDLANGLANVNSTKYVQAEKNIASTQCRTTEFSLDESDGIFETCALFTNLLAEHIGSKQQNPGE